MDDIKQWYLSRTVWGALVAIAASLAHSAGLTLSAGDQSQIVDGVVSVSGAIGGLLAIYGRVSAKTRIG